MYHDLKIVRRRRIQRALVIPVPPEEFGISREARGIKNCGYCFHDTMKREHELIADGYDPAQVRDLLPSDLRNLNAEEQARDTVEEGQSGGADAGFNSSNREVRITEHYVTMQYESDPKPCMYRVVTGGEPLRIMIRNGEEEIAKWQGPPPFAAGCPFPMPHRFIGRSVADLVMDIQKIKTAVLRGWLDNIYSQQNPQLEIAESHATVNTMGDALTRRPEGVIRTKQPGGIQYHQLPDISSSTLPAMQYMDTQREWRTGVSRQGQGVDANSLQNQVATIANQMENAAQSKVKMIARILAETGIKDLFLLLHATIRRNGSIKQTIRLRNRWITVDPRDWKQRDDMTVHVGLGTGSKASQLMTLQMLIQAQTQAIQVGLVTRRMLYNSAKELVRIVKPGADVGSFFLDPTAPPDPRDPPIPPPTDPKQRDSQNRQQQIQAKGAADIAALQGRMALEEKQAQTDIAATQAKAFSEAMLQQQRHRDEQQNKYIDMIVSQAQAAQSAQHKREQDALKAHYDARLKQYDAYLKGLQNFMRIRMQPQPRPPYPPRGQHP